MMAANTYNAQVAVKGQSIQQANLRQIAERPILVKPSIDYGRWIPYDQYLLDYPDQPYFTRGILPNELVFDFDRDGWSDNLFNAKKLIHTLEQNNIPFWVAYSGGKGLHCHVFFDINSLTIDQDIITKAQEELVDITNTIRTAIWNMLLVWSKVDKQAAKLDYKKVNFDSKKKGSMLRDFGTPREKNGQITYKTLIDDIPELLEDAKVLPLVFPPAPILWDVTQRTRDIEKAIQNKTRSYKRSTIDVSLEGVGVSDVYCLQKFIKDGIPDQAPIYYAAYTITRGCHDLGLPVEQADANVTTFLNKCNITEEDRQVRHDNALNGYDQDQHHLSCSSVKENYGDEYCSKSCSIYQKRREAKLIEKGATTKTEKELFTAMGEFPGPLQMAEQMQEKHPIYYDKTKSYWLWLHDERRYTMVDETDILNAIHRVTKMNNLVQGKMRSEILTAIQMTGRELAPKEPDKHWIQFKNYMVDVRKKDDLGGDDRIITATPEYFITSRIPHNIGNSNETPYIDQLFIDWVGEENKQILYEICAYCMLPDYPLHRMFWFVGRGRNGKGRFMALIKLLIGAENTTSTDLVRLGDASARFESSKLYKKLVAFVGETDFGVLRKTNVLKSLTGDDLLPGEFKNKNPFDFNNYAKILIATNSVPKVDDKTDGWYSRNVTIDFPNQFSEGKDVIGKIEEWELENLCRKCINILPELLKCGIFHNEGTIEEKRMIYESKSNPIFDFLGDECIREPSYTTPIWHIKEALDIYLDEKGLRKYTHQQIRKEIEGNGYETQNNIRVDGFDKNGQWVVVLGLRLKNNPHETKVDLTDEETNITNIQETLTGGVSVGDVGDVGALPVSSHVMKSIENTPTLPTLPTSSIIDQSIPMYEAVKKTPLNSTNVVGFVEMVVGGHPDITKDQIINYLEHIGRLTPKIKGNGDRSCVSCGAPGKHQSKVVVDRNTDRIEYRCDTCYEQYQRGRVVKT